VRVASKVGNLLSKFGHARPFRSGIIRYVRDGRTYRQTDGETDGQKQRLLPLPTVGGITRQYNEPILGYIYTPCMSQTKHQHCLAVNATQRAGHECVHDDAAT